MWVLVGIIQSNGPWILARAGKRDETGKDLITGVKEKKMQKFEVKKDYYVREGTEKS